MNDTDSLLMLRLRSLRAQPKTVRGRCILWYASLSERPFTRFCTAGFFALLTALHAMWLCLVMLNLFLVSRSC